VLLRVVVKLRRYAKLAQIVGAVRAARRLARSLDRRQQ
jgi:hypothetical protein